MKMRGNSGNWLEKDAKRDIDILYIFLSRNYWYIMQQSRMIGFCSQEIRKLVLCLLQCPELYRTTQRWQPCDQYSHWPFLLNFKARLNLPVDLITLAAVFLLLDFTSQPIRTCLHSHFHTNSPAPLTLWMILRSCLCLWCSAWIFNCWLTRHRLLFLNL